ncbi:MAG: sigma-70 family RNA polymerase sigma factor [Prevotella sp.]|nr:sigma-70 family RNA polymerase sigma factor [Prevotella sp.]
MNKNDAEILGLLGSPATFRKGFERLINVYSEPLYWKIRRIVLIHEDADDVLQNTFLKIWSKWSQFQGKSNLSTWIYRIAINEAIDYLRRKKNLIEISSDDDLSVANHLLADDYFDGDEAEALLQEAIARLPEVQRTVFNLRYYNDMKYSEISQILNTSEGSLKASYHLAVQKITKFLKLND